MAQYVISESFNMENESAWILSGRADSIEEFINHEMIDGYEAYIDNEQDIAFLKYPEKAYMIFRIE